MAKQLHKKFEVSEVKEIFERYLSKEVDLEVTLRLLGIGRSRFFDLLRSYREKPDKFCLEYRRKSPTRRIDPRAEKKLWVELKKDHQIVKDRKNPVRRYNYSFIRETLAEKHDVRMSLSTIISRAKKMDFIRSGSRARVTTGKF